jgi:hypothetical protein
MKPMRMRKWERWEVEDGGGGERLFLDARDERYVPLTQLHQGLQANKYRSPREWSRVRPEAKKKWKKN